MKIAKFNIILTIYAKCPYCEWLHEGVVEKTPEPEEIWKCDNENCQKEFKVEQNE